MGVSILHAFVGDIYMPQRNAAARPKHPRTGYFVTRRLFDELDGFADLEARIAKFPVGDRGVVA
jgi:hypothetical protein